MAVIIRLTRGGAKKVPFYRVIAADRRSPRDGRFIEQIGIYDPLRNPPEFRIDADRLHHWLRHGAQPSPTVSQLIKKLDKGPAFEGHPLKSFLARYAGKPAPTAKA